MTTKAVARRSLGRSVPNKNGSQKSPPDSSDSVHKAEPQAHHEGMAVLLKKLSSDAGGLDNAREQRPVCAHRGVSPKP